MNIQHTNHIPGIQPPAAAQKPKAKDEPAPVPKVPTDKVSLSEAGKSAAPRNQEAEAVKLRVEVLPEVRPSMLEQARKEMFQHGYEGEEFTEKIAEKLIDLM